MMMLHSRMTSICDAPSPIYSDTPTTMYRRMFKLTSRMLPRLISMIREVMRIQPKANIPNQLFILCPP